MITNVYAVVSTAQLSRAHEWYSRLFGRNSDSPMPIIAPSTPGDCFETAYEACRIAVKYMTPVMYLSDGYLANGAEPWKLPDLEKLKPIAHLGGRR